MEGPRLGFLFCCLDDMSLKWFVFNLHPDRSTMHYYSKLLFPDSGIFKVLDWRNPSPEEIHCLLEFSRQSPLLPMLNLRLIFPTITSLILISFVSNISNIPEKMWLRYVLAMYICVHMFTQICFLQVMVKIIFTFLFLI